MKKMHHVALIVGLIMTGIWGLYFIPERLIYDDAPTTISLGLRVKQSSVFDDICESELGQTLDDCREPVSTKTIELKAKIPICGSDAQKMKPRLYPCYDRVLNTIQAGKGHFYNLQGNCERGEDVGWSCWIPFQNFPLVDTTPYQSTSYDCADEIAEGMALWSAIEEEALAGDEIDPTHAEQLTRIESMLETVLEGVTQLSANTQPQP
jgi:hypothetical protein